MTLANPPAKYPEERRLATVLFADVQGFTTLAEQIDFEHVSDLIKELWLRLDTVIASHGGYIDKHIGDAVMAVWGAPHAGENDAEHAVAAALALQASLREYARTTHKLGADHLQIRVGINTGLVFAGYVGIREEYTMIGDTVNVANRLEQAAEPGTVMISDTTYRLVRGAFRMRRLTTMSLRGKAIPVRAYEVEGAAESLGGARYRGVDSMQTFMVGREEEMEKLYALYRQSLTAKSPLLVMVEGEPGLGKSRLMMEFTSQLEVEDSGSFTLIAARALDQAAQIPFYLWKSLWMGRFDMKENEPPEVARDKFTREIFRVWGSQLGPVPSVEVAHLVGSLLGIDWPDSIYLRSYDDPEQRVLRAFDLTRELLRRISSLKPLVVILDDLHWADRGSLDLLAHLMQTGDLPLPMMILAAVRPDFLRQQPRWMNLSEIVTLKPVPFDNQMVVAAYPDLRVIPDNILSDLVARADGNPYFLEEMVKGLVKSAQTDAETTPQEIMARLRAQPPESLRSMLQARLDGLSREAKAVALLASVVGRVFWVGAISAAARANASAGTGPLSAMPSVVLDRVIQDGLRQLVRAELAFPRANSPYSTEQEYIFKHSLLREVAYNLIPHKYRQQYHLAVAHWLTSLASPDFKVMAAEHFERAGATIEATRHFEQAAQYAHQRGALQEARTLAARALALHSRAPEAV